MYLLLHFLIIYRNCWKLPIRVKNITIYSLYLYSNAKYIIVRVCLVKELMK